MARVVRYGAAKADRRLHNPAGFFEVVNAQADALLAGYFGATRSNRVLAARI